MFVFRLAEGVTTGGQEGEKNFTVDGQIWLGAGSQGLPRTKRNNTNEKRMVRVIVRVDSR